MQAYLASEGSSKISIRGADQIKNKVQPWVPILIGNRGITEVACSWLHWYVKDNRVV